MPKPVGTGQRYLPGLDGLRALAVLAVIAYHEQFGWAQGGLLGVGVFFTLSGFLITSLLIEQWTGEGRLRLGDFWMRRARRLLPAVFVMLAVVTAWVTVADRARLAGLRGAVGAAAGYFSNWYLIAKNQSYFARFAPPAPLDHLWSLAVEEQFYLIWPLLLMLGLFIMHRLGAARVRWLILPTTVLAVVSVVAMVVLYRPGFDPTRVYEGTDTRAFGLLIGAALALAWPAGRASRNPGRRVRLVLDVGGFVGLAVIGVMIWRIGEYSAFSYRGGLVLLSIATAAVVAPAAVPGSLVGQALGWRPLRWIGARSYGIYLWHYPVIVLTTPANAGPDLARALIQTAAVVALAALSWRFIEEPIRHGAIGRVWAHSRVARHRVRPVGQAEPQRADLARLESARTGSGRSGSGGTGSGRSGSGRSGSGRSGSGRSGSGRSGFGRADLTRAVTGGAAAAVVLIAGAGLAGVIRAPAAVAGNGSLTASGALQLPVTKTVVHAPHRRSTSGGGQPASGGAGSVGSPGALATGGPHPVQPGSVAAAPSSLAGLLNGGQLRTSCRSVAHIGDSTSDGLVSPDYLPNKKQRIVARYEGVGAQTVVTDIEGARSIVEVLPGGVNAYQAAKGIVRGGFNGCWVLALGTDDTADVAVGSNVPLATRIARMMQATRGEPVMWVNVKSLLVSGAYAESDMQRWNQALVRACARYPNMRIYDWASEVHRNWFISDGIHYTSLGYEHRAQMIADALANAFPQGGHSTTCVVGS